jgi:hypothetical protein
MTDDEQAVRLELLIGHLADILTPARDLVGELRLRANASTVTRGELEHLSYFANDIWMKLDSIREQVAHASLSVKSAH